MESQLMWRSRVKLEVRAKRDAQLLDQRWRWVFACASFLAVQIVLWVLALVCNG
jgi:hypothetical protein